ncbi:hypothetical protein KEM54_000570, partial [Ascosphaera aggregata]
MAPRGPSRTRDYDYSNLGKAGRRTGITLREGEIDEDGMENLEGMFSSSPEPAVDIGNATVITSEDMDIGGSKPVPLHNSNQIIVSHQISLGSAPDPEDVLVGQRERQHRENYVLPPRSRSPMKTFLSGSPRRTPILRSSPNVQNRDVSSPITSRMAANRALEDHGRPAHRSASVRQSHVQATETQSDSESESEAPIQSREIADFSDNGDDDGGHMEAINAANEESLLLQNHDEEELPQRTTEYAGVNGNNDETLNNWDEAVGTVSNTENERQQGIRTKARGGKKPRTQSRTEPLAISQKSRPGTRRAPVRDESDTAEITETSHRSKRVKSSTITREEDQPADYPEELDRVVDDITSRNGRNKSRSLYILKREEPRDAAHRTRSGRVSVRPLAYWRNERCVYGEGGAEIGQRFPLSTIKEVIRTEEPERPQRGAKKKHTKGKSGRRHDPDDPSDDDANVNADPWENEGGGVFYGPVKKWDNDEQKSIAEEEVMDLAYAPIAVQTHPVRDATFSFAKILSTPFLGSGFVDMPPHSMKRTKNSKKMHMVFYMIYGRIQVEISGLRFSAGKGTVFQVPR